MIAKGARHVICGANTRAGLGCCVFLEEFTRVGANKSLHPTAGSEPFGCIAGARFARGG